MPNYTAPVDDMMFLFDKLRNNKNYNEIEKYKEVNSELVKNILNQFRVNFFIFFNLIIFFIVS